MKGKPESILKKNPGIEVKLSIDVINKNNVKAHLTIKNNSELTIPYYKALLGVDGIKERFIGIADKEKNHPIPYTGPHPEEYEGGSAEPVIVIYPKEAEEYYLLLKPGEKFVNELNLTEAFDFSKAKGEQIALYTVVLPAVSPETFEQIKESDLEDGGKIKPVYYDIDSGEYTKFKIE